MLSESIPIKAVAVPRSANPPANGVAIKTTGFIEALLEWRASGGKKWSELFATPEQLLSAGTSFEEQAKIIDMLSGEGV